MDREIVVDYKVLDKQMSALARAHGWRKADGPLLDGLFELLEAILEQRPFKEGKD